MDTHNRKLWDEKSPCFSQLLFSNHFYLEPYETEFIKGEQVFYLCLNMPYFRIISNIG